MGCRRYFVANRLEVLVDEDDSRSSSRVRTRKFSACFTTARGNPDTLKSMSSSSRWVNKPMDCSLSTGLPVLTWSESTFSSAWVDSCPFLTICFWFLVGFVGSSTSSNFWTQFFHPIVLKGNLRRRSRWRKYFLICDFSSSHHDSLRDTISWEACRKGWLHYILFDRISILFVEQAVYRPNTPFPGVFSTSACTKQDAVHPGPDLCVPCSLDPQTWRIPSVFPCQNFVQPVSILSSWLSVNWLHIQYETSTRRNCPELTHCPEPPGVNPEFMMECEQTSDVKDVLEELVRN